MATRDGIAAVLAFSLGAAAMYEAGKLPFGTVRNPGQGFFPWWLSLALALLSLVLLANAVTGRAGAGPGESGGRPVKVLELVAILAAYTAAVEPLGYPVSTFLLVLFMLRVTEPHRWPLALSVAGIAAGGSYLLFAGWLGVALPPGPLGR